MAIRTSIKTKVFKRYCTKENNTSLFKSKANTYSTAVDAVIGLVNFCNKNNLNKQSFMLDNIK